MSATRPPMLAGPIARHLSCFVKSVYGSVDGSMSSVSPGCCAGGVPVCVVVGAGCSVCGVAVVPLGFFATGFFCFCCAKTKEAEMNERLNAHESAMMKAYARRFMRNSTPVV